MESNWEANRPAFYNFFMVERCLQAKLQLLSQIMEGFIYVTIINGINFSRFLGDFAQNYIVFAGLLTLCILKLTCRLTLRFGSTLIALQLIINCPDMWLVPNCVLLSIVSIAQLLSSMVFNYSSQCLQAESRIENKAFQLILLMGNIIVLSLTETPTYIHLVSSVLFLGLLWSQERSLMKSEQFRKIALRFYLWAACQHLRLFISVFFPISSDIAILASFLISQSIFALIVLCRRVPNCQQLLAKQEHLKLSFILLCYTYSSTYDPELEEFTTDFIGQTNEAEIEGLNNASSHKNIRLSQKISQAVLGLLGKSYGFFQAILKAELHLKNGRLPMAMETLIDTKAKLTRFDWMKKIILMHAEERLKTCFSNTASKMTIYYQSAWKDYLIFQELLYKASSQHLRLSLYLKRTEIDLQQIKSICSKITSVDIQAMRMFQKVRNQFSVSTQLFVGYLARVRGDCESAGAVISQQQLREHELLDYNLQQKLFVRLLVLPDCITIGRAGFNAHELLGYRRDQLEGQNIERLLPQFFRNQHQRLSTVFIHDSSQQTLLFQKETVILNNRATYSLCSIMLRLMWRDERFCYQGYIRVVESSQHDLASFFCANASGAILESSEGIFEEEETQRTTKVEHLLNGTLGQILVRTTANQHKQAYDPIVSYNGEESFYFYAKRLRRKRELEKDNTGVSTLKELTTPMLQSKVESAKQFAEEEMKMVAYINNKEIMVLFVIVVVLILGLFCSEYLMIVSAYVKYNNQNFAVNNFINLMNYYNSTVKLELNLMYQDLQNNYNYSNSFFQADNINTALSLQTINEKMKQFNLGKYKLPTYNPDISYQQSNYDLTLMLVTNAYLSESLSGDSFFTSLISDQAKLLIPVQAIQSITDYRISIFNLMTNFVQQGLYYENLSLWISVINILLFIFPVIRIFWKLRQVENYALERRCSGSFHVRKVKDVLEFMKEITLEDIPIDKISEEMHVYDITKKVEHNNTLMSEASLIRQNTTRNLSIQGTIPLETLNKTGFIQDMQKNESKPKTAQKQTYNFRKTHSYRYLLIVFAIFISFLVGLDVSNDILNYKYKNIDEVSSLNSVITIYRSNGYYSTRGIIITLNAMLQKNLKNNDISASYLTIVQSLYNYIASFTLPIFPEVHFSEFSDFSLALTDLYQQPICSYITCDPQYYDQLNLNFISVIKKYSLNLSTMFKTTFNYSQSEMGIYLQQNKRYIDLLFYTETTLRGYITGLMLTYLNSYNLFMNNLLTSKMNFIGTMIGITVVGFILFLFFVWHIRKEQKMFVRMIKIYREPISE